MPDKASEMPRLAGAEPRLAGAENATSPPRSRGKTRDIRMLGWDDG